MKTFKVNDLVIYNKRTYRIDGLQMCVLHINCNFYCWKRVDKDADTEYGLLGFCDRSSIRQSIHNKTIRLK